jgi:hypothetical protein
MNNISKKDLFVKNVNKKLKYFKNINPKYYILVTGLIITAILVKKYRVQILNILKLIFNV